VLCAVSILKGVPAWREASGEGWATCEYSMLPAATRPRQERDGRRGPPSGRSVEIQRIIGRALRAAIDLAAIPGITLQIDCDVLDADGSTRTAAITGAYVALRDAVAKGLDSGILPGNPLVRQIAAVSVGVVDGRPLLDLAYEEDSRAEFDCNVVGARDGALIEVQGTAEHGTIDRPRFDALLDLAAKGLAGLFRIQDGAV
jgi:ribonuclease PH